MKEIKMSVPLALSQAAFEDALIKLGFGDGLAEIVTITVHPSEIYQAGYVSQTVSHFSNYKIALETDDSFNESQWEVCYNDKFIRYKGS